MNFRIVNSDNFATDYMVEYWANNSIYSMRDNAQAIADEMQAAIGGDMASRYFKVVPENYQLITLEFEP